ncbi:MAG: CRISPR-associated protein Cas4 [Sulfolobaceae archaeon]
MIIASDIKRMVYCPLFLYYQKVLGVEERRTEAMKEGEEIDREAVMNFLYPTLRPKRVIRKPILRYRDLSGEPDYILEFPAHYSPLEIKATRLRTRDHKVQLAYYMYLMEMNGMSVKMGFIYYVNHRLLQRVYYNYEEKREVMRILDEAREILKGNIPRVRQPRHKCENCWYFNSYCRPKLRGGYYEV